jgi:predicted DNA-binding protein YlxM (UPF0122 family)
MKVVSTKEGYTLMIDLEGEEVLAYETNCHMNAGEIADNLNITKNAISQILRRSIKKVYNTIRKNDKYITTFDIIRLMVDMFNIKEENEYRAFYKMLPVTVKENLKNGR